MKKLLLLLLLIPSVCVGQDTLKIDYPVQIIADSIYQTIYDTVQVQETIYDTTNVESLTLQNVEMGFHKMDGVRYLTYRAETRGDSVQFQYYRGTDLLGRRVKAPKGGVAYDTLRAPPLDNIDVTVSGYWEKWVEKYREIVNITFLDTLGQEPMSQYYTDFQEYTNGQDLLTQDWTSQWHSTFDWEAIDDGTGNIYGRLTINTSNRVAVTWDEVPASGDVEIYGKIWMHSSVGVQMYLRSLVAGTDSSETSFDGSLNPDDDTADLRYTKYVNGSFSASDTANLNSVDKGEFWHMYITVDNSTGDINIKAWEDGTTEPGSYQITVTDTDISSATDGLFGVGSFGAGTYEIHEFGVGTNGDVAPREPVSGGSTVDVDMSVGSQNTVTHAGSASVNSSVSTSTQSTVDPGGTGQVDESLSNDSQNTVSASNNITANQEISVSSEEHISASENASINTSLSTGTQNQLSETAFATGNSSLSIGSQNNLLVVADAIFNSSLSIGTQDNISISSTIDGSVNVYLSIGAQNLISMAGDASVVESITNDVVNTITVDGQAQVSESLSQSIETAFSLEKDVTITASLSTATQSDIGLSGTATANSSLSQSIQSALVITGQAIADAGITEATITGITISSQGISTSVTLADGRTLTITLENRTFTIPEENRIFAISSESRILDIDAEDRTFTIEKDNRTLIIE